MIIDFVAALIHTDNYSTVTYNERKTEERRGEKPTIHLQSAISIK